MLANDDRRGVGGTPKLVVFDSSLFVLVELGWNRTISSE